MQFLVLEFSHAQKYIFQQGPFVWVRSKFYISKNPFQVARASKETPLMKQYNQIKAKYPDALLLFRVGDFYETFGADAIRASKILGILLTKRGAGSTSETELAGFPHHSLNTYLPKLVKAGCRVAICDQLEDPKMTKKIVKRGVTELVTPGVSLNEEVLEQKQNNYLAAYAGGKHQAGVAFLDISTGDFWVTEGSESEIAQLLQSFSPSELLVAKPQKAAFTQAFGSHWPIFYLEDWVFAPDFAEQKLTTHFETASLQGFGVASMDSGIAAAAAVLHYLSETQHDRLSHIHRLQRLHTQDFVWMDRFTVRNLELFQANAPGGVPLIEILDHTQTPMGGRLLRHWLAFPLLDEKQIQARQGVVAAFLEQIETHEKLQEQLSSLSDIERIGARIATYKVSPRALNQLLDSLELLTPIQQQLRASKKTALTAFSEQFRSSEPLTALLQKTLHPEAPVVLSKGQVIAEGFHSELDALRGLLHSGKEHLDAMLERETQNTQIPSLKIAFNNVFGYYIEVRNTHKDKVPEEWIRKQTLVNAERYITEELKEYEAKILGAEDKIKALEAQIYQELLDQLQDFLPDLKHNAQCLGRLDVLWSFAFSAKKYHYHAPEFVKEARLEITAGRHPVIERQLPAGTPFIPNSLRLDAEEQQLIMITGPNMSGKSAILRQTALIALLAQMGSFVPAEAVQMQLVDKIFTRVGASDNISLGESTFMVEMNETASILNNITPQSLVLLDEIGRGTSTYDGISIAWAIAEFLHEHPSRAKVLFATHYHELNEMTQRFDRIKNYNVSVQELPEKVLFLRKLEPGGSAHSFGIHVAKMAGMPQLVLQTAQKKLKILEAAHGLEDRTTALQNEAQDLQLSIFNMDDPLLEEIRAEISTLDLDTLTPVEALMKLHLLQQKMSRSKDE
jgi:DNA mismatch repair protein MutS